MAHALNLTAKLKTDEASRKKLGEIAKVFATDLQPKIEHAMRESKIIHFARILVIGDNEYIQVLTEFDGDKKIYTTFFLNALGPIFKEIFSIVEGAPSWDVLQHPDQFYEYTRSINVKALGTKPDDPEAGFLFSAYGGKEVKEILPLLS
jgi:hypothetical protein